jgi:hypothetical protein
VAGRDTAASFAASVFFAALPGFTSVPTEYFIPLAVAAAVITVALAIPASRRRLRVKRARLISFIVACLVLALVAGGLWWHAGSVRRYVSTATAGICSDGMWVEHRASCYPESEDHLVRAFEKYDLSRWHGWDEVGHADVTLLNDLAPDGPALAGRDLLTLGVMADAEGPQDFGGGQLLIPLRAPTDSEASRVDAEELASLTGSVEATQALLAGTIRDDAERVIRQVACRLPSRPFFSVSNRQILVIKGTLLANGLSMDRVDGKPLQVSYVICSSAEHVTVSEP